MPSLGIALHPGGCSSSGWMLMPDAAPVPDVFPAGAALHLLEVGIQAIKL
jgi:hypothetical protein